MSGTFFAIVIAVVIVIAAYLFYKYRGLVAPAGGAAGAGPGAAGAGADGANIGTSTLIIGTWVIIFALIGVMALATWSFGQTGEAGAPGPWRAFGLTALIGLASASVGALIGFIFGIPRTLDPASRVAVANAAAQGGPAVSSQAALAANTNLERVSDWLTTLLIGATLVQAGKVIDWIGTLGATFSGPVTITTLTPLVVIYYAALGFLGTYLVSRLYLTYALQQTLALLTGVAAANGPTISPTTMPPGVHGTAYGPVVIRAVGGTAPLRWAGHDLPDGLAIDPSTGAVAGTPTTAAASTFTVVVTDTSAPPLSTSADIAIEIS